MIHPTGATRVFLACGVTDMRKGFNSLYAIVEHQLKQDPTSGHLFAFCNRKRNRLKCHRADQLPWSAGTSTSLLAEFIS